jgi:hypothetical protein
MESETIMKLYNWTLSISPPLYEYFDTPRVGVVEAEKNVETLIRSATGGEGETPEYFVEWLSNIGCAVTNVVFFDGAGPFGMGRINLLLISPDSDLAAAVREEKQKAPKSVNYFYTTRQWLGEPQGESSSFPFPQWILGVMSSPHIALSNSLGTDSAFKLLLVFAREKFEDNPAANAADLVAADIYSSATSRLPKENSIVKMLPDFKRELSGMGISDKEMAKLAVRAMEKRGMRAAFRPAVSKALALYRG